MHPCTFPKGMDLIVAMATAPDPDARFGVKRYPLLPAGPAAKSATTRKLT
jgi:hypothetical protein